MSVATPPVRCRDHLDVSVGAVAEAAGARGFRRVAAAFFALQAGGTLPIPLYVLWQQQFGFATGTLTLIFAAYALGTLISLFGLAPLSDQLGRRPAMLAAIGLAALSSALFVLAHGVLALVVARVLSGMAVGLATAAGTAALRELEPRSRAGRGSLTATTLSLAGLGAGPLLAGLVAKYASDPTKLVFWLYLAALVPAALVVLSSDETVARRAHTVWRPRAPVLPAGARRQFALAAGSAFCAFTLFGLFSSLVPSFLVSSLHERDHLIAGAIAALIFAAATAAQLALNGLSPRAALQVGLPLVALGISLIEVALWTGSLAVFLAGTVTSGVAAGTAFMGATAIVNQIAPPERRAGVLAAYFASAYAGIAIPAVTVGVLSESLGTRHATLYCAIVTAALAMIALAGVNRDSAQTRTGG